LALHFVYSEIWLHCPVDDEPFFILFPMDDYHLGHIIKLLSFKSVLSQLGDVAFVAMIHMTIKPNLAIC
jgi:hypothetical protein